MRKFLILGFAVVLAVLTLGMATGSANAAAPARTATFTAYQPSGTPGVFATTWNHVFTVQVAADGTFSGIGVVDGSVPSGNDQVTGHFTETVTGSFSDDYAKVALTATRTDGSSHWSLTNAPTDGTTETNAVLDEYVPFAVPFKVTAPTFANGNHGECVSGATHAGLKGNALTAFSKDNSKVGPYGSATCKI